jgi:predicted DNA-binding protein (UPF0251 family)
VNERARPDDRPNGAPSERRSLILALARGWLLMGSPTNPVDPRRRIGAHRRLKDILLGTAESRASRDPWARFSGAMDRQALEEALAALSEEELELVGLAFFEGRTNGAIARQLGLSVATVQRRLRSALGTMSKYLRERGAGTWGLAGSPGLLEGHRLRGWIDARFTDQLQAPVRELAQVAVGALVVATVVGASVQVVTSRSNPGPAAQAPASPAERVQPIVGEATPSPVALVTTPSPQPTSATEPAPVAAPQVTLVGGSSTAGVTTTAQQTVTLVSGTVSTVTAVKLPSPPPVP